MLGALSVAQPGAMGLTGGRSWVLPTTAVANTAIKGNANAYLDGFTMSLPTDDWTLFFTARVPSTTNTNWHLLSVGNASDTILTDNGNINIGIPANGANAAINYYPWTFSAKDDAGNWASGRVVSIFGAANVRAIMAPSGVNNTPDNVTRTIAVRKAGNLLSIWQIDPGTTARKYSEVTTTLGAIAAKPARLGALGRAAVSGFTAIEYQMVGRIAKALEPWQLEAIASGVDPRAVTNFSAAAADLLFAFSGQASDGQTYTDLVQGQVATAHGTFATNPQLLPTSVVLDQARVEIDRYQVLSVGTALITGVYTGDDADIELQLHNEVNGQVVAGNEWAKVADGRNGKWSAIIPAGWVTRLAGYRLSVRKTIAGVLKGQSNFLSANPFHVGENLVHIGQSTAKGMREGAYTPTGAVANNCSFFSYGDGDLAIGGNDEALLATGYARKVQAGYGEGLMSQYIGNTSSIMLGHANLARSGSSILEWNADTHGLKTRLIAFIKKNRPKFIGPWNQGANSLGLGLNYEPELETLYGWIAEAAADYSGWYFLITPFTNNYSSGMTAASSETLRSVQLNWALAKIAAGDPHVKLAATDSDHPFEGMRPADGIHPLSTGNFGYALNAERFAQTVNHLLGFATHSGVGPRIVSATWDSDKIVDIVHEHNGGTALQSLAGGNVTGYAFSVNGFANSLATASVVIHDAVTVRATLVDTPPSAPIVGYQRGRPGFGLTTIANGLDNPVSDNRVPYLNTTRGFPVMPTTTPIQSVAA